MSLNLQKALLVHFASGSFGLPVVYENLSVENGSHSPVLGTPYAELNTFMNDETPANLATSDETDGYLQITLRYPTGESDIPAKEKADEIKAHFYNGLRLTYAGHTLTIKNKTPLKGQPEDGWYKVIVRVNFVAILPR